MEANTPYQNYIEKHLGNSKCRYLLFDHVDKVWHCSEGWGIQGESPCSQIEEALCPIALSYKFCIKESFIERDKER